ncbi:MAG: hypothetical protein WAU31_03940 [Candidatus Moraniibacteriota bacterium]
MRTPEKREELPNQQSLSSINHLMPDDFFFLLLRLINYPHEPVLAISANEITKLRLKKKRFTVENRERFLRTLSRETDIKVIPKEVEIGTFPREFILSEKSIEAIRTIIDIYLKKFVAGELEPMESNCFEIGKQKEYFLDMIRKNLAGGTTKNMIIADSKIEEGYRFFETLIVLEQKKYLKIKTIYNCFDENEKDHYRILIEANQEKIQPSHSTTLREPAKSIETTPNITWSDVHMKFREDSNITVTIGDEEYQTNCEKMGFQDRRKPKIVEMKKCWGFLYQLAMTDGKVGTNKELLGTRKEYSKWKQDLTKILKAFFPSIVGDPFEPYDETHGYRIKIKVEPETRYKEEQYRDRNISDPRVKKNNPYADTADYCEEQSPLRYEEPSPLQ